MCFAILTVSFIYSLSIRFLWVFRTDHEHPAVYWSPPPSGSRSQLTRSCWVHLCWSSTAGVSWDSLSWACRSLLICLCLLQGQHHQSASWGLVWVCLCCEWHIWFGCLLHTLVPLLLWVTSWKEQNRKITNCLAQLSGPPGFFFNPVLLWFSCCTHTYNHKLLCLVCFFSPPNTWLMLTCAFGQEAAVLLSILRILTASKNVANKMWKKIAFLNQTVFPIDWLMWN